MPSTRTYDIVLYGATGFTGQLTAAYLLEHLPSGSRFAIAGRNLAKLTEVRERLGAKTVDIVQADAADAASLAALAASASVVVSTVGPYLLYGEPLVKACAEAGTTYLDLTGEPEFVDRMFLEYDAVARDTGARLIHCCGFDSVPHDLGAYFTVKQLPPGVPVQIHAVVRSNAAFSGGTFHSLMAAAPRVAQMRAAAWQRRQVEALAGAGERRARTRMGRPRRDRTLGYYLLPLPTIDPMIVARSAAALPEYGPDFTYTHYAGLTTIAMTIAGPVGVAAILAGSMIPPVREAMKRRMPAGQGPSPERRERSYFTVDFVGRAGSRTVHTRVSGGDPGYTETAKMLAQAALSAAFDANPSTAGQVTTVQAMGESLLRRLQGAGIDFAVIED